MLSIQVYMAIGKLEHPASFSILPSSKTIHFVLFCMFWFLCNAYLVYILYIYFVCMLVYVCMCMLVCACTHICMRALCMLVCMNVTERKECVTKTETGRGGQRERVPRLGL